MFKMLGLFMLFGVISILGLSCGGGSSNTIQLLTGTNTCSDGIYNNGEEGLDCGGMCSNSCSFTAKSVDITADETWSGNIRVTGNVAVASGVTLTIAPGTVVKFQGNRDYKSRNRPNLSTDGGVIKAVGTKDQMIWFTSDASSPIQSDWGTINVSNSDNSELKYVIVEYATVGIELINSSCPISYSIVRWSGTEGIYAEYSSSSVTYNTMYGNGWHEMALEHDNVNMQIKNNLFRDGESAIHAMINTSAPSANIENNYFKNYSGAAISVAGTTVNVSNNTFESVNDTIIADGNSTVNETGSQTVTGGTTPQFDYTVVQNTTLGYKIGSESDQYPYVYDTEDRTRKIVNRVGKGTGFGGALAVGDGNVWRVINGGLTIIETTSGAQATLSSSTTTLDNIQGLTHDGQYLWALDGSQKIMYQIEPQTNSFSVVSQFTVPDAYTNSTIHGNLATDGTYLFLGDGSAIYKFTKTGTYVETIPIANSTFAFDGTYFWTEGGCSIGFCKYDTSGNLVGGIYQVAEVTDSIASDGNYLWSLQKTCEVWNDDKIFQIEVLDDSL